MLKNDVQSLKEKSQDLRTDNRRWQNSNRQNNFTGNGSFKNQGNSQESSARVGAGQRSTDPTQ